jgi:hypothetical protein
MPRGRLLFVTTGNESGGAEGARTPGLMTASHALSQLSYSPVFIDLEVTKRRGAVNSYFCRIFRNSLIFMLILVLKLLTKIKAANIIPDRGSPPATLNNPKKGNR